MPRWSRLTGKSWPTANSATYKPSRIEQGSRPWWNSGGPPMIDHIGLSVADYERSKAFYRAALAPLGYGLIMEVEGAAGLGAGGKPGFWIGQGRPTAPRVHIAFAAA